MLHEAAYSNGPATRWAAERARLADPRFALDAQPAPYLTGEAVFPWMLEELGELRPLREVADVLADHEGWAPLYDIPRLRANTVPVVGTLYWDDEYVERTMALETVSLLGNCSPGSPTNTSTVAIASTLHGWPIDCSRCWTISPHVPRTRAHSSLSPSRDLGSCRLSVRVRNQTVAYPHAIAPTVAVT